MTPASSSDTFARVVARAWSDEAYKQRLTNDPGTVLAEAGVTVPDGVDVRVLEDSATTAHFVIPRAPEEGEISEEALGQVSGGGSGTIMGCEASCCPP